MFSIKAASGSGPGLPNAQWLRSVPSTFAGIGRPAIPSSVGMMSGVFRHASLVVPAGICPGQRIRNGTRTASS